jgi:hypothetical protein
MDRPCFAPSRLGVKQISISSALIRVIRGKIAENKKARDFSRALPMANY